MNIFTCFSRIAFAVFLILMFTAPFAVAEVVDIPDANLRARIEVLLNKAPGDAITVVDMQTLTLLSAVNADIHDLTGLEHATNLVWLVLADNAISDIMPLVSLTQLAWLDLDNNPLSAESLDRHLPVLRARGVTVFYTLPSDVNGDGIVSLQDLVSVTQYFGSAGDLTVDVNRDGIVNITDLTQVAGDMGDTTVNAETPGATDAVDTPDTAPSENPPHPRFLFPIFIEQLISDLKEVLSPDEHESIVQQMGGSIFSPHLRVSIFYAYAHTNYKELLSYDESIFQTPGKGFKAPILRPPEWNVLGNFIPDAVRIATLRQINEFSAKYKLTRAELILLSRHLLDAKILIGPAERHEVYMPDENLRKVVVALINELGISLGPTHRPKELTDPIYAGEMRKIKYLAAPTAGIHSLIGLEYATNLIVLRLENLYDVIWVEVKEGDKTVNKYKVLEPATPNRISDLTPLRNLTNLIVLHLGCNAVSDLTPLRNLSRLKWLDLNENEITALDPLADLTNLEQLFLSNAYYSPLWAGDNRVTSLAPLKNLTNLTVLDLNFNAVSDLTPLRNLRKLIALSLEENKITDISPLADLTNLEHLFLGGHHYSRPPWVGNNEITSLAPLQNLRNLTWLHVSYNPIRGRIDIVRNFPKLRRLEIGCCGVSNLRPLVENPGLRGVGSYVDLTYSRITEEALPDIKTLEGRGVGVAYAAHFILLETGKVWLNYAERCSLSYRESNYRESLRAAPALQLLTEPDVLSAVWQDLSQVPEETSLLPNYPNPFNPETWIPYQLAIPAEVTVTIHAADGRLVQMLALGYQAAGMYQSKGRAAYWDGRNAQGEPVASGVYFYTLMAGDFTATRKLLIRK